MNNPSQSLATPDPIYNKSVVVFMMLGITIFDFILGPTYQFGILVVIPVLLASWRHGLAFAAIIAIVACILRFLCHWVWGFPLNVSPAAINTIIRAIALVLLAVISAQAAWKYQRLKLKIQQLEGHLPTCSSCGHVQKPNGEWIPLDTPIPAQEKLQPLCSVCAKISYK